MQNFKNLFLGDFFFNNSVVTSILELLLKHFVQVLLQLLLHQLLRFERHQLRLVLTAIRVEVEGVLEPLMPFSLFPPHGGVLHQAVDHLRHG